MKKILRALLALCVALALVSTANAQTPRPLGDDESSGLAWKGCAYVEAFVLQMGTYEVAFNKTSTFSVIQVQQDDGYPIVGGLIGQLGGPGCLHLDDPQLGDKINNAYNEACANHGRCKLVEVTVKDNTVVLIEH